MSDAEALLALIDAFHITDRTLIRARDHAREGKGDRAVEALYRAAAKYFGAMEAESRRHLSELDRKLDDLYQRQYNLQAERGVVERRLRGARGVLDALEHAQRPTP